MAQCPKCNGSGRVLSHLNPHDVDKVGAGMGMHRCDRCAGQGIIHGASGSDNVGQQLGEALTKMILALFFASGILVCWILACWHRTAYVVGNSFRRGHKKSAHPDQHRSVRRSGYPGCNIQEGRTTNYEVDTDYRWLCAANLDDY